MSATTLEEMAPDLLTIPEAARRLGMHRDSLYRLARAGEVPHRRCRWGSAGGSVSRGLSGISTGMLAEMRREHQSGEASTRARLNGRCGAKGCWSTPWRTVVTRRPPCVYLRTPTRRPPTARRSWSRSSALPLSRTSSDATRRRACSMPVSLSQTGLPGSSAPGLLSCGRHGPCHGTPLGPSGHQPHSRPGAGVGIQRQGRGDHAAAGAEVRQTPGQEAGAEGRGQAHPGGSVPGATS